jgi:hypothetical protein
MARSMTSKPEWNEIAAAVGIDSFASSSISVQCHSEQNGQAYDGEIWAAATMPPPSTTLHQCLCGFP